MEENGYWDINFIVTRIMMWVVIYVGSYLVIQATLFYIDLIVKVINLVLKYV
jgi:hypothetical protein